jgi:VanZ family protein
MIGAFHPRPPNFGIQNTFNAALIVHVVQYFLFAFLYFIMRREFDQSMKCIYMELFFIGAIVSVGTEEIQRVIPGRTHSWWDVIANLFGFYSFILLSILALKKRQKNVLTIKKVEKHQKIYRRNHANN